jgi:hypothetical protein
MMNSELMRQSQKMARSKIESGWKDVANNYTLGWGGPLEAVEVKFPHISDAIPDIRSQVSSALPLIIYQTRQSPPESTSVAVPYESGGDPYKCRLVSTDELSARQRVLLGEFAQAIWFLIDTEFLPDPNDGGEFESKLIGLTDARLISL